MRPGWKMQRYNNGCFPACLAMLMSGSGVELEDFDVITALRLPFRLKYYGDAEGIVSGIMLPDRDPGILAPFLSSYGLKFISETFPSFHEYREELEKLLSRDKCVVTGLPVKFIPSALYAEGKTGDGGHAVVLYAIENDFVSMLDPSGGLNRNKEWNFEDAKPFVDLKISMANLEKAATERNRYILGHLTVAAQKNNLSHEDNWMEQSIEALAIFRQKCIALGDAAAGQGGHIPYDTMMEYIFKFIKPVVMDWRTAITALKERNEQKEPLTATLSGMQTFILNEQQALKTSGAVSPEFRGQMLEHLDKIETLSGKFLNLQKESVQ